MTPLRERTRRFLGQRAWLAAVFVVLSTLLAACEDQGNPGNDNLFTGASLIVVLLIVGIIIFAVSRRRGSS